jgi:hypothetical protein
MAGLDPAIQNPAHSLIVLPWMAASEGGHDVEGDDVPIESRESMPRYAFSTLRP